MMSLQDKLNGDHASKKSLNGDKVVEASAKKGRPFALYSAVGILLMIAAAAAGYFTIGMGIDRGFCYRTTSFCLVRKICCNPHC